MVLKKVVKRPVEGAPPQAPAPVEETPPPQVAKKVVRVVVKKAAEVPPPAVPPTPPSRPPAPPSLKFEPVEDIPPEPLEEAAPAIPSPRRAPSPVAPPAPAAPTPSEATPSSGGMVDASGKKLSVREYLEMKRRERTEEKPPAPAPSAPPDSPAKEPAEPSSLALTGDVGASMPDFDGFAERLQTDLLETLGRGLDDLIEDESRSLSSSSEEPGAAGGPARGPTTAPPSRVEPSEVEGPSIPTRTDSLVPPERAVARTSAERERDAAQEGGVAGEKDLRERRVAYRLAKNFEKLPANMRNELLKNLSKVKDIKVREDVVLAVASNYDKLPADIQQLLQSLAKDEAPRIREEVAFEVGRNFVKISKRAREDLLRLLHKDDSENVRLEVAATVIGRYSELPTDVRDLLRVLARDKATAVRDELEFQLRKEDCPVPDGDREAIRQLLKAPR